MEKQQRFYYVYLITNLINGKQYVGDHPTCNLKKDYYFGGGLLINKAKKKYKRINFKKEILEFFPSKQEAFDAQEKYIKQFNTLTPNGYNISPTGGFGVVGCHSEETKKKIGDGTRGKLTFHLKKHVLYGEVNGVAENHVYSEKKERIV